MTQISQSGAEIALIFDQPGCRPSVRDFQVLTSRLRQVDGVVSVMTRLDPHGCQKVIIYFLEGIAAPVMLRRMVGALRSAVASNPATTDVALAASDSAPRSAKYGIAVQLPPDEAHAVDSARIGLGSRLRQFIYGTLAGGSFVMAWVGLVVPGIPTVPFVILTAAFAAKASPAFHRRLIQSRIFGPMINDWETYHAIRRGVRTRAIGVTIVIVAITVLVAPPSPALYSMIAMMATLSFVIVMNLPIIPDEDLENGLLGKSTRSLTIAAVA